MLLIPKTFGDIVNVAYCCSSEVWFSICKQASFYSNGVFALNYQTKEKRFTMKIPEHNPEPASQTQTIRTGVSKISKER